MRILIGLMFPVFLLAQYPNPVADGLMRGAALADMVKRQQIAERQVELERQRIDLDRQRTQQARETVNPDPTLLEFLKRHPDAALVAEEMLRLQQTFELNQQTGNIQDYLDGLYYLASRESPTAGRESAAIPPGFEIEQAPPPSYTAPPAYWKSHTLPGSQHMRVWKDLSTWSGEGMAFTDYSVDTSISGTVSVQPVFPSVGLPKVYSVDNMGVGNVTIQPLLPGW